jgi:transposase
MYDNTIKLYKLESISPHIESLETTSSSSSLILHLTLKKINVTCPICQTDHMYFHGFRHKKIIHSISVEDKILIDYASRRYRCRQCQKVISEPNPFNQKYQQISLKTKLSILSYLKDFNHTFTDTAKLFNVSIQSVIDIFDKSIDARRKTLPEVICIDEVFTSKMNKYKYACVLLDFKSSKLIDVIATRHKNYLIEYFSKIPLKEKASVKVFIMDMWDSYRDTVKLCFPHSLIAVDSFHIIRNLNEAIKAIRIKAQQKYYQNKSSLEHQDMYYYMLKKFHYFFVKDYESIYDGKIKMSKYQTYWHKSEILSYLLTIDDDLTEAYRLKERYRAFNLTADYETCDDDLQDLIDEFRNSKLAEFRFFGKTIEKWKVEIKNSFIRVSGRRISNGPIESTNSKIKTIIKTANGIRSFYRFRNRVLYSINKDIPIQNK